MHSWTKLLIVFVLALPWPKVFAGTATIDVSLVATPFPSGTVAGPIYVDILDSSGGAAASGCNDATQCPSGTVTVTSKAINGGEGLEAVTPTLTGGDYTARIYATDDSGKVLGTAVTAAFTIPAASGTVNIMIPGTATVTVQ